MITLDVHAIPTLPSDVVARDDAAGKLLFQIGTDEMFLVDLPTFELLRLCDGERTVQAIAEAVADAKQCPLDAVLPSLLRLLADLRGKGLVELWEERP